MSEATNSEIVDDEREPFYAEMTTNDLFIKDAFLVFRALCKLTMKPLNAERYVLYPICSVPVVDDWA